MGVCCLKRVGFEFLRSRELQITGASFCVKNVQAKLKSSTKAFPWYSFSFLCLFCHCFRWFSYGFPMVLQWCSICFPVVPIVFPGFLMVSPWFSCGFPVGSQKGFIIISVLFSYCFLWFSLGFPWFRHGFLSFSLGFSIVPLRFSYGFPIVSYGFLRVSLLFLQWFPYGFLWFYYGVPMVFL